MYVTTLYITVLGLVFLLLICGKYYKNTLLKDIGIWYWYLKCQFLVLDRRYFYFRFRVLPDNYIHERVFLSMI